MNKQVQNSGEHLARPMDAVVDAIAEREIFLLGQADGFDGKKPSESFCRGGCADIYMAGYKDGEILAVRHDS